MASRRGPDNSVRIAISGTNAGTPFANVFHCQLTTSSSISQADLAAWTTLFANRYKTDFGGNICTNVTYLLATSTLYTPGGGVLSSQQAMTGNGGGGSSPVKDSSSCKVVSWTTTVYWRGGKPRTYLPSVDTAEMTSSQKLTTAEITALSGQGVIFRNAVNAFTQGTITGTQLGFVSFNSGNAPRTTPLFFAFTGCVVHARIGTQRRRLGKWSP